MPKPGSSSPDDSPRTDRVTRRIDRWLALLSILVPRARRDEWRQHWRAELLHHRSLRRRHGLTRPLDLMRHASGALVDAVTVRLDGWREGLFFDFRLALRGFRHRPAAAVLMITVLALGIGGSVLVGGVVDSILLAPLPYPDPDRLVRLWEVQATVGLDQVPTAKGNLLDFRRARGLDGLAGYYITPRTIRPHDEAEVVEVAQVSADFFAVLGRAPAIGRTFNAEETARAVFNPANSPQGEDPVIVLSHELWRTRFQSDRSIVGRTLELESRQWQILGVMPPGFEFPSPNVSAWIPWSYSGTTTRDQRYVQTIARLGSTTTLEQAEAELAGIADGLAERFPETNRGWQTVLEPLHESTVGPIRSKLWVALAAVGCIWLLATVNVAVLRLVQARQRHGEITIRRALGASSLRLSRLVLIDSAVPVFVGGGLGLAGAYFAVGWLRHSAALDLPRQSELVLRPQLLLAAFGIALLTSLLVSLGPAILGARATIRDRTRTAGRATQRWRSVLVTVEVALATVLLVGAGLLGHSLWQLYRVDPGFDAGQVLVAPIILDNNRYGGAESRQYYRQIRETLEAIPGITSVGATTVMPMSSIGPDFDRPVWAEGRRPAIGNERQADMRMATPNLFDTLRIELQRGRDFGEQDRGDSQPVTIVNRTLADRLWPGRDPIGETLHVDLSGPEPRVYEVVGMIADVRRRGLREPPRPEFYVPHAQRPYLIMNLAVRVEGSTAAMIPTLERQILDLDRSQPAHSITAMADLVDGSVHTERVTTFLVLSLGTIALLLATVGVYGSLAMTVDQRRREFGIRIALGAGAHQIRRRVLGTAALLVGGGLVIGSGLAIVAGRWLGGILYGVEPLDPMAFAVAIVSLAVAGLIAAWRPVSRALSTDPARCLHAE